MFKVECFSFFLFCKDCSEIMSNDCFNLFRELFLRVRNSQNVHIVLYSFYLLFYLFNCDITFISNRITSVLKISGYKTL